MERLATLQNCTILYIILGNILDFDPAIDTCFKTASEHAKPANQPNVIQNRYLIYTRHTNFS